MAEIWKNGVMIGTIEDEPIEELPPSPPTTEEKIAELEKQVADLSATLVNQI